MSSSNSKRAGQSVFTADSPSRRPIPSVPAECHKRPSQRDAESRESARYEQPRSGPSSDAMDSQAEPQMKVVVVTLASNHDQATPTVESNGRTLNIDSRRPTRSYVRRI